MKVNNRKLLIPVERVVKLGSEYKAHGAVWADPTPFGAKLMKKGYVFDFGYEKNGQEMALVEHSSSF